MAHPKLRLITSSSGKVLETMQIEWIDGRTTDLYFICDGYFVKHPRSKNTGATSYGSKSPKIPFDIIKSEYSWNGHIDVDSSSVFRVPGAPSDIVDANLNTIDNALFLNTDNLIQSNFADTIDKGENIGSLPKIIEVGETLESGGDDWFYKGSGSSYVSSPYRWLIDSFKVTHNGDGTSRIEISLHSETHWEKIPDIIDSE